MSGNVRPNLNGLFNGTTPPERSSVIADALGPKSILSAPAAGREASEKDGIAEAATPDRVSPATRDEGRMWPVMPWINPVTVAERYFSVVQAVLDVNRELAVGVARAVSSIAHRGGVRR